MWVVPSFIVKYQVAEMSLSCFLHKTTGVACQVGVWAKALAIFLQKEKGEGERAEEICLGLL